MDFFPGQDLGKEEDVYGEDVVRALLKEKGLSHAKGSDGEVDQPTKEARQSEVQMNKRFAESLMSGGLEGSIGNMTNEEKELYSEYDGSSKDLARDIADVFKAKKRGKGGGCEYDE